MKIRSKSNIFQRRTFDLSNPKPTVSLEYMHKRSDDIIISRMPSMAKHAVRYVTGNRKWDSGKKNQYDARCDEERDNPHSAIFESKNSFLRWKKKSSSN
uniref:Uncharacterized protein n=1 Tax=Strigamia maritima TaxID=126957 RepID=T1J1S2_STRMM